MQVTELYLKLRKILVLEERAVASSGKASDSEFKRFWIQTSLAPGRVLEQATS